VIPGGARYRLLFGILLLAMALAFVIYTHSLVGRLRDNSRKANETIAWFWASSQIPLTEVIRDRSRMVCSQCGAVADVEGTQEDSIYSYCSRCGRSTWWFVVSRWSEAERTAMLERMRALFRNLIGRLDYTTVMTDDQMHPQIVNGVVVDGMPPDSLRRYMDLIRRLSEANPPIPMTGMEDDTLGWLLYGSGALEKELKMVPYMELGILGLLGLFFFLLLRTELKREKVMAWAGFAKETAHQLSTPISSLMGWLELLRDAGGDERDSETLEAVDAMQADVNRLNRIADRYGQMGKRPKLTPASVNDVVSSTVRYFRDRPGLAGGGVEMATELEAQGHSLLNRTLLDWVMENLIKNSLAAVSDGQGTRITVATADNEDGGVSITVEDDGKGIPYANQERIFSAGFTTRRGGWGLGLTLSRRIVEEYHGGRLRLVVSHPGQGSIFEILLPAAGGDGE
jgi:signal transduction histidine kinase